MTAPTIRATTCPLKAPVVDGRDGWGGEGGGGVIMSEKGSEALNKKR